MQHPRRIEIFPVQDPARLWSLHMSMPDCSCMHQDSHSWHGQACAIKVPSSCMHACMHACRAARDMTWACSVKFAPSHSCMHDTCLGGSKEVEAVVPRAAHLRDRACVLSVPACLKSVMPANFPPSMSMIPVTACMLHVIRQRLSHVGFQVMHVQISIPTMYLLPAAWCNSLCPVSGF